MKNFCPNVVSFLLISGARRWYIIGAYMPSNYIPTVHWADQELVLAEKLKGIYNIFLGTQSTTGGAA